MPEVLDFESEREKGGDSWERAHPRDALVERMNRYGWRVYLPDGENTHHVVLAREGGKFVGRCHTFDDQERLTPCKGHQYGDGPCAHLCTIRKAAFINATDADGDIVTVHERDDELDVGASHDHRVARADGGVRR
jgi:hypothetical protein